MPHFSYVICFFNFQTVMNWVFCIMYISFVSLNRNGIKFIDRVQILTVFTLIRCPHSLFQHLSICTAISQATSSMHKENTFHKKVSNINSIQRICGHYMMLLTLLTMFSKSNNLLSNPFIYVLLNLSY